MNAHLSQIPAQLITEESRGQFGFDRYIYGTYNEMVKLLGKPTYKTRIRNKTTVEWNLYLNLEDGKQIAFSIYDYDYNYAYLNKNTCTKFHIGIKSVSDGLTVHNYINNLINEKF